MAAEALALDFQLSLPPPVGDLFAPAPAPTPLQAEARVMAHGPRPRRHRLVQLWLIPPPVDPAMRGVVRSLSAALEDYRQAQQKARKRRRRELARELGPAGKAATPRKERKRPRSSRSRVEVMAAAPPVVVAPVVVEVLADVGLEDWDWSPATDAGRLVDGGEGADGWAAWRGSVVEVAMAKRAKAVQADLAAKGAPTGPRQVRTKQQAQAAATAVLMAGKPGKKKAVATTAAVEGAKA